MVVSSPDLANIFCAKEVNSKIKINGPKMLQKTDTTPGEWSGRQTWPNAETSVLSRSLQWQCHLTGRGCRALHCF